MAWQYFTFEQLASGVHAAIMGEDETAASNAGIVDLGDRTLLFDTTMTPRSAQELRRFAEETTGRSPDYVINSHMHGDHVFGNQVFPNGEIISTAITRQAIDQQTRSRLEQRERDVRYEISLTLPTMSFEQELNFFGSRRTARLLTVGGGHTASDAILFLPAEGIIFIGDLIFNGYHPYIADGNAAENIDTLEKIKGLGAERYVPGHGDVAGVEQLNFMQQYLTQLMTMVSRAKSAGATREAVAEMAIPADFSHLINMPGMFESTVTTIYDAS